MLAHLKRKDTAGDIGCIWSGVPTQFWYGVIKNALFCLCRRYQIFFQFPIIGDSNWYPALTFANQYAYQILMRDLCFKMTNAGNYYVIFVWVFDFLISKKKLFATKLFRVAVFDLCTKVVKIVGLKWLMLVMVCDLCWGTRYPNTSRNFSLQNYWSFPTHSDQLKIKNQLQIKNSFTFYPLCILMFFLSTCLFSL